jgi:hypothetical protein
MRFARRSVNALLGWPGEASAARPFAGLDVPIVSVDAIKQALDLLQHQQVVWVGTLFNMSLQGSELQQKVQNFDKRIQICPEC